MADSTEPATRKAAIVGGNRIPFARSNSAYAQASNQDMLTATLDGLEEDELLPVARAFNQFLNLANIAEQQHRVRRRRAGEQRGRQAEDRSHRVRSGLQ